MPAVRGLEGYLREHGLVQNVPLECFKGCNLGLDGFQFIRCSDWLKNEPLHTCIGGLPLSLRASVSKEIDILRSFNVNPYVVFGGLQPPIRAPARPPLSSSRSRKFAEKRHGAWTAAETGKSQTASFLFGQMGGYVSNELQSAVFSMLQDLDVQVMRAPYSQSAQLSCFSKPSMSFFHAVFGGLELLLYGVERVVLSLNYEASTVEFVALEDVLEHLSMSHEQFLECCLLAGFDLCRTFPPLLVEHPKSRVFFHLAVEVLAEHGSALEAIRAYAGHTEMEGYEDVFMHTVDSVRCHSVMVPGARVLKLNHDFAPTTATATPQQAGEQLQDEEEEEFVSCHSLPEVVFRLLMKGRISAQLLNVILSDTLVETAPIVDSREYGIALDKVMSLRSRVLYTLAESMGLRDKHIHTCRWYAPSQDLPISPPPSARLPALAPLDSDASPCLSLALQSLPLTLSAEADNDSGESAIDSFVHTLMLAGLAEEADGSVVLNTWGEALQAVQGDSMECAEELLLVVVLLRSEMLHGDRLHLVSHEGKEFFGVDGKDRAGTREGRLLQRVASVLQCDTKHQPWSGPVHRELCAFQCIRSVFWSSLEHAAQVAHLSQQHGTATTPLPFSHMRSPTLAMSLLVRCFLQGTNATVAARVFPQIADPLANLSRFCSFWKQALALATEAHERKLIDGNLFFVFRDADAVLGALCLDRMPSA